MVIQQWRAVGIAADPQLLERSLFFTRVRNASSLFFTRVRNDRHQVVIFSNSGSCSATTTMNGARQLG
jgi:hypothetical protein